MELKELDPKDLPMRVEKLAEAAWNAKMVEKLMAAYERKMGKRMEKAAWLTVEYLDDVQDAAGANRKLSRQRSEEWAHRILDALLE